MGTLRAWLLAALTGCGTDAGPERAEVDVDGPFWVARVHGAGPLSRPPSLDAPTPETPEGMDDPHAPPPYRVWVRGRHPGGLEPVLGWADDDGPRTALLIPPLDVPGCARVRAALHDALARRSTEARSVLAYELATCADPADQDLFAREDVADEAAIRWARFRSARAPTPDVLGRVPRFVEAYGVEDDVEGLLEVLCETDRPDLADGLWAVLAAAPDREGAQRAARACPNQTDARLAGAWADTCAEDWCPEPFDVLSDLDATADHPQATLPPLAARYPALRASVVDAAARCVLNPSRPYRAHCLSTLAELDWGRAAELSASRPPSAEPELAVQQKALRFDSPEALGRHLLDAGLPDGPPRAVDVAAPTRARTWLHGRGRVYAASDEGDDVWAAALAEHAAVMSGALPDARFEQLPALDGLDAEGALRGWIGDRRWHMRLPPDGSGVARVVALLNAMAAERRSRTRFVLMGTRPWAVTWGPEPALRSLIDEGLLTAAELDDHWPAPIDPSP